LAENVMESCLVFENAFPEKDEMSVVDTRKHKMARGLLKESCTAQVLTLYNDVIEPE